MSNQTFIIDVPEGKKAEWVNGVLTLVDTAPKKPKNVMERIKTFEDALNELGSDNEYVQQYEQIAQNWEVYEECRDFIAYFKLRIIAAALNEGWQPQFTGDEERWYPWFWLYTQDEINRMDEDECRNSHMITTGEYQTTYSGFAYAYSYIAPSATNASVGSRLCLKTDALATYAGKQFIEIWGDFMLR